MSKSPPPVIVAVVSDLHVGSSFGLCPPNGINLEDGGLYVPNVAQRWIWDNWADFWDNVKRRKKETRGHCVVVVNGEFIDGLHHETTQLASASPDIMRGGAVECMRPVMPLMDELYVTIGTPAHSGAGGASDYAVARELGARQYPHTGRHAAYQWLLDVNGVLMDFAHHVSGSGVPWSKGNNIRREVMSMMADADGHAKPPDIVVRSHVHQFADTGRNFDTYGVVTPAWQLKTEYAHRVTRQRNVKVGGLVFEVRGPSSWSMTPHLYRVPSENPHRAGRSST